MKTHRVLLLFGGNLGQVKQSFEKAQKQLEARGRIEVGSAMYRTEAWGMGKAPDFLNQAVIYHTTLDPMELLSFVGSIEAAFGRTKSSNASYESRVLDIDILLYDHLKVKEPGIEIPHPRMHQRNFTLVPAAEIAGNWQHPILNKSVAELLKLTEDTGEVMLA